MDKIESDKWYENVYNYLVDDFWRNLSTVTAQVPCREFLLDLLRTWQSDFEEFAASSSLSQIRIPREEQLYVYMGDRLVHYLRYYSTNCLYDIQLIMEELYQHAAWDTIEKFLPVQHPPVMEASRDHEPIKLPPIKPCNLVATMANSTFAAVVNGICQLAADVGGFDVLSQLTRYLGLVKTGEIDARSTRSDSQ